MCLLRLHMSEPSIAAGRSIVRYASLRYFRHCLARVHSQIHACGVHGVTKRTAGSPLHETKHQESQDHKLVHGKAVYLLQKHALFLPLSIQASPCVGYVSFHSRDRHLSCTYRSNSEESQQSFKHTQVDFCANFANLSHHYRVTDDGVPPRSGPVIAL